MKLKPAIVPWLNRIVVLAALVSATACTTVVQRGPGAGVVAQLSVERFLEAANQRDLETMGRLFGSTGGPVLDTGGTFGCAFKKIGSWFGGQSCVKREEVEIRLDAIANVLSHDDYRIVREQAVAGRMNDATHVWVDFTINGSQVKDIPFVVVRTGDGRWLVEQVDLQKVMSGGTGRNPLPPQR